jgi:hypothetical protein
MKQLLIIIFISFIFIGCQKNEKVTATSTNLMFVNTCTDISTMEFFIDSKPLLITPLNFLENTYYREFIEGNRKLTVKENGNTLLDTTLMFVKNTKNTVLLYDYATYLTAKILNDEVQGSPLGQCELRVIQASPNLPLVKLLDNITNTEICTLNTLGSVNDFKDVIASSYDFKITDINNSTLYIHSTLALQANKNYTLLIGGTNGGGTNPINMRLIQHDKF